MAKIKVVRVYLNSKEEIISEADNSINQSPGHLDINYQYRQIAQRKLVGVPLTHLLMHSVCSPNWFRYRS